MKTHMHTRSKKFSTLQSRAWMVFPALFASLLLSLALAQALPAHHRHRDRRHRSNRRRSVRHRSQCGHNAIRAVTTSEIGSYKVTQLQPGNYSVKVEKASFKAFEQSGITLQIEQIEIVNAQLQIGSTGETITVTSAPPAIQTEDSSSAR